jgi:hypothetical protein
MNDISLCLNMFINTGIVTTAAVQCKTVGCLQTLHMFRPKRAMIRLYVYVNSVCVCARVRVCVYICIYTFIFIEA